MKIFKRNSFACAVLTMAALAGTDAATAADALAVGQLKVLHTFTGDTDGRQPYAGLLLAKDSHLYGTTSIGGTGGGGTLFRITRAGELTTLFQFSGYVYADTGSTPNATLIEGRDGNLYGTTVYGGTSSGTVFRMTKAGQETVLHVFDGVADGQNPWGGLVQDTDGSLYGTTLWGGGPSGYGTFFKVDASGNESVVYACPPSSSSTPGNPVGGLVQARGGALFGTSSSGGAMGAGGVVKIAKNGQLSMLASFDGVDNGDPGANLIQGEDGAFYGTTRELFTGTGSVFKVSKAGVVKTLHKFLGGDEGSNPYYAGLVETAPGVFYGVTAYGGLGTCTDGIGSGCGTLFRVTAKGEFETLYRFTGGADGGIPMGTLVADDDGVLYGTTIQGGTGAGVVFKYRPQRP